MNNTLVFTTDPSTLRGISSSPSANEARAGVADVSLAAVAAAKYRDPGPRYLFVITLVALSEGPCDYI